VLGLVPAGAQTDLQTAAGQHVERSEVLGQDGRMAQAGIEHEGAHPQPLARRRDHGQQRYRGVLTDEMVGQYKRGAADGLGLAGQGGQLGEAGVSIDRREKAEGTHTGNPSGGGHEFAARSRSRAWQPQMIEARLGRKIRHDVSFTGPRSARQAWQGRSP